LPSPVKVVTYAPHSPCLLGGGSFNGSGTGDVREIEKRTARARIFNLCQSVHLHWVIVYKHSKELKDVHHIALE
jgi:hypothetical protein